MISMAMVNAMPFPKMTPHTTLLMMRITQAMLMPVRRRTSGRRIIICLNSAEVMTRRH